MVGGWNWRLSATCPGPQRPSIPTIGTACAQRYTVRPDLSCGTGLRSRGRSSPRSPKSKSAVPEFNRNGAQGDSSRERAGGWFAQQSFRPLPASHPRSQVSSERQAKRGSYGGPNHLGRDSRSQTADRLLHHAASRLASGLSRIPGAFTFRNDDVLSFTGARRCAHEDDVDACVGGPRVLTVPALREGDGRNGREDQRQGDDDVLELQIEPPSGSGGRGSAGTE